jgi:hypothetical protein
MNLIAQDSKFKLFIKGGISDYGLVNLSIQKSGNASDDFWEIGPIIGAGLELSYGEDWFFQSTIEYSQNTYNGYVPYTYRGPVPGQETIEPGTNTVVDWMMNLKKKDGPGFILFQVLVFHLNIVLTLMCLVIMVSIIMDIRSKEDHRMEWQYLLESVLNFQFFRIWIFILNIVGELEIVLHL